MAASEKSEGEAASALLPGTDTVAQGPAAPRGAASPPQLSQDRPTPAAEAEGRPNQGLGVGEAEAGQPGEAPPGSAAGSELGLSAGLLRQPASGNVGPLLPAQASGLSAPPLPGSSPRCFVSVDPPAQPPPVSTTHNAAQQLRDVARRVALQQGKSGAAAAAVLPAARLLPPKQLETICVQLKPDQTKENERPALSFATIQSQNVTTAQPVEKNAKVLGLNVINSQIIRIEPVTGTGSHQLFLHNSPGPTIQLLLQRPLHPHGQVSANKITIDQITNEQRNKSPTQVPNDTVVSTNAANSTGNCEKKHREQKLKKNLKVKTRSGRISRPPKYKAKDYKFIKTEDLAECHQSDSDDYSELSVEEDEEGKQEARPLFGSLNYDLRPKLFKCQTCEKSYIGNGGLARHYKLNPDHGPQESSPSSPMNSFCRMALLEDTGKANGESSHQTHVPSQVIVTCEKANTTESGQQSGTGGGKRMFAVQQTDISLLHLGPGRPRQRGCPRNTERSRYSDNRPGQFPCKSLNNMSAQHHGVFKRKARLKELIQQCANEDFMELVVPHFTAFVTVFEFLLMKTIALSQSLDMELRLKPNQKYGVAWSKEVVKVKKDDPTKTLFPDVYREFEELHAMVMKMCQEYFSNPEIKEPVEIKNPKVAESLGMNSNLFGVQNIQAETGSSPENVKNFGEHVVTEASGQKRAAESSDEMLPLAKRSREQSLLENPNDYSSHHRVKEISATNEDFFPEDSCVANTLAKEQHESLKLEATMGCENPDLPSQPMKAGLENLQLSRTLGLDSCPSCCFSCNEMQPSVSAENLEDKPRNTNSSWNTASVPRGSEFCNSLASEESGPNPDLPNPDLLQENSHNEKYQLQQEENEDSCVNKKVEQPKNTDNVDELEKYLPDNVTAVTHPFEPIAEKAAPV